MAAVLEENTLQIQQLPMIFFCERSSNMAAIMSDANKEYVKPIFGSNSHFSNLYVGWFRLN